MGVKFDDKGDWPVVVLRDANNGTGFGIAISKLNVYPILLATDPENWGDCGGRPVTHDFTLALAQAGSLHIERLVIDRMIDGGIFGAVIEIRLDGGEILRLDVRPSDAIPVALGAGAPIFVAEAVVAEVKSFPIEEIPYRDIKPEDVPGT
jgi:hypothetical protein